MAQNAFGLRRRRQRGRRREEERGFTVIEVMIAFSLLLVMLIPAIALMQQTVKVSGDIRHRIVSANLPSQQLEITRALQFPVIPKPPSPDQTWNRAVGRIAYTVHQRTA